MRCTICEKTIHGFGHNAQPVAVGQCCDACNIVIDLMSWATCDVCEQFLTEGDMTCTCDEEFEIECWSCENMYNGEAEHICPHCYASKKRGIRAWLKYLFLRR